MSMRTLRRVISALACLAGTLRAWNIGDGYSDFNAYYLQTQRFLAYFLGTADEYFLRWRIGETSPFRYLPVYGWLFAPFTLLPLRLGRVLWVALQWGFVFAFLKRVRKFFSLGETASLIVLLGILRFALDNAFIAQASGLITWLLIESATAQSRTWAGAALALASGLKLQPLVISLGAVLRKESKFLQGFGVCALGLALGSLTFGRFALEEWWKITTESGTVLDLSVGGNQAMFGAWFRITRDFLLADHSWDRAKFVANILNLLSTVALSIWAWFQWKRSRFNWTYLWVLGLALLPVCGILTWKNTYLCWAFPLGYAYPRHPRATLSLALCFLLTSEAVVGNTVNGALMNLGFLPAISVVFTVLWLKPISKAASAPVLH